MAGSVGRGTFVPPVLVDTGAATPRPTPLDGGAVADLRSMMASVVSSGSGTALRGTSGGPVRGKTGTAEHGSDPDVLPRVWFAGYQGNVAFAVLVEEGRSGGTVAAPIAKDFLTNLARD
jgi:cell division protein FtsI/penicillin-binding protein 2